MAGERLVTEAGSGSLEGQPLLTSPSRAETAQADPARALPWPSTPLFTPFAICMLAAENRDQGTGKLAQVPPTSFPPPPVPAYLHEITAVSNSLQWNNGNPGIESKGIPKEEMIRVRGNVLK